MTSEATREITYRIVGYFCYFNGRFLYIDFFSYLFLLPRKMLINDKNYVIM